MRVKDNSDENPLAAQTGLTLLLGATNTTKRLKTHQTMILKTRAMDTKGQLSREAGGR